MFTQKLTLRHHVDCARAKAADFVGLLGALFGNRNLVMNLNRVRLGTLAPVLSEVFGTEMIAGVLKDMASQLPLLRGILNRLIKVVVNLFSLQENSLSFARTNLQESYLLFCWYNAVQLSK